MNALFDEQNFSVVEHSAEAIVPVVSHDSITVHHEIFAENALRNAITAVGGVVHHSAVEEEDQNV